MGLSNGVFFALLLFVNKKGWMSLRGVVQGGSLFLFFFSFFPLEDILWLDFASAMVIFGFGLFLTSAFLDFREYSLLTFVDLYMISLSSHIYVSWSFCLWMISGR